MPKLKLRHYLIIGGVMLAMWGLASVERPIVTKAVTRIVNELF
jgi:hypothetical protein